MQSLKQNNYKRHADYATEILNRIDLGPNYIKRVLFSDEATYHVSGTVNRHDIRNKMTRIV